MHRQTSNIQRKTSKYSAQKAVPAGTVFLFGKTACYYGQDSLRKFHQTADLHYARVTAVIALVSDEVHGSRCECTRPLCCRAKEQVTDGMERCRSARGKLPSP